MTIHQIVALANAALAFICLILLASLMRSKARWRKYLERMREILRNKPIRILAPGDPEFGEEIAKILCELGALATVFEEDASGNGILLYLFGSGAIHVAIWPVLEEAEDLGRMITITWVLEGECVTGGYIAPKSDHAVAGAVCDFLEQCARDGFPPELAES